MECLVCGAGLAVVMFLFGLLGSYLYPKYGYDGYAGFAVGALLGPLMLIVLLVMGYNTEKYRKCPRCTSWVYRGSPKCKSCGQPMAVVSMPSHG